MKRIAWITTMTLSAGLFVGCANHCNHCKKSATMPSAQADAINAPNDSAQAMVNTQSAEDALTNDASDTPADSNSNNPAQAKIDPSTADAPETEASAAQPSDTTPSNPALTAVIPPPPADDATPATPPTATPTANETAVIPPIADETPASQPAATDTESTNTDNNAPTTDSAAATTQPAASANPPATQPAESAANFDRGSEPQVQPGYHFALGQNEELEGHPIDALTHYDQALRLDPNHVPSLYRMGVVLTKQKKYDDAATIWQRYIAATGNHASGYANLGFTWEMAGNVANAEDAYKQGLAIDSNCVACRANYGLMLARNNRTEEAQQQLAQVMTQAEVSFNLATIYEQQGAMARAKEELQKALAANPNMKAAADKLATLPQD